MSEASETKGWELTGWHVLAIFLGFFGTIIAVNLVMASMAVGTFPGLEAKNGFVASQSFEARRDAQDALGWELETDYSDGLLTLTFTDDEGGPVEVPELAAVVGRATHVNDDILPEFQGRDGVFRAGMELDPGNWNVRIEAQATDGTAFARRVVLRVK
ncbi:MAG: FixH family protein [Pseudomonadota bacterium]